MFVTANTPPTQKLSGIHQAFRNTSVGQLAAFVQTAELGSITKAAKLLNKSQPNVSWNIKELETRLGVTLFERRHGGVVLTRESTAILQSAKQLLQCYRDAQASAAQAPSGRAAQIRVSGSCSVMRVIMPALLTSLKQTFNNPTLIATEGTSEDVVRQVLDGKAAVGVCCSGEQQHPALRYTRVLDAQFGLLAPEKAELPTKLDTLLALNALPMVRVCDRSAEAKLLRQLCPQLTGYFQAPIVVASMQAALELARNCGFMTVTTGLAASQAAAQGLRFVPLPDILPKTQVHLVSRRTPVFNAFDEQVHEALRDAIHQSKWHNSVHRVGVLVASMLEVSREHARTTCDRCTTTEADLSSKQLRIFAAVAECGSISAATKQVHLSESAMSRAIHGLERALGASLFIRQPGKWALTRAAELLLVQAKLIVDI